MLLTLLGHLYAIENQVVMRGVMKGLFLAPYHGVISTS